MNIVRPGSSGDRIPFRLVTPCGQPRTGVVFTEIASATVIRADGTIAGMAVTASDWTEISPTKAPGLYHLRLSSIATTVQGETQVTIRPVNQTHWTPQCFTFEVSELFNGYQYLVNRQKRTLDTLAVYDNDQTTIIRTFNLTDSEGNPALGLEVFGRDPV